MKPATVQRVLAAIQLMQRFDWGVDRASKAVHTDRRTVYRYLRQNNIRFRKDKYGKIFIPRTPDQKKIDFLHHMTQGDSATAAARKVHTTVRSMKKVRHKGNRIIVKKQGKWENQYWTVYDYSLVVYGKMTGFNGKTLGRGPDDMAQDDDDLDEDYADIWWQVDFNSFHSTLPTELVGECHAEQIYQIVKARVEAATIQDVALSNNFSTFQKIQAHMATSGRATGMVSPLEQAFRFYDLQLEPDFLYGVDDSRGTAPVRLIKRTSKKFFQPVGAFQVIVMRKGQRWVYPQQPIKIHYRFTLKAEDGCRNV